MGAALLVASSLIGSSEPFQNREVGWREQVPPELLERDPASFARGRLSSPLDEVEKESEIAIRIGVVADP